MVEREKNRRSFAHLGTAVLIIALQQFLIIFFSVNIDIA